MQPTLILAGASVRAAAVSALRAGYGVWGADLFTDQDFQTLGITVRRIDEYPQQIPQLLAYSAPPGPFLFTGGLENFPDVLDQISQQHPLWCMNADTVRRVRNPLLLQQVLGQGGFPTLDVTMEPPRSKNSDSSWVRKPLASAGGQRIRMWESSDTDPGGCYWQEYRLGDSYSALYLGGGQDSNLIGLTHQLVGTPWLHAKPFAYAGNVGPLPLAQEEQDFLHRVGNQLSMEFGLRGLFGIDFIREDDQFYVAEVNPRYTASVELYELAYQLALLPWHASKFTGASSVNACWPPPFTAPCLGKAILYAPRDLVVTAHHYCSGLLQVEKELWSVPATADLPRPSSIVRAGQPVLSLMVAGENAAICQTQLKLAANLLDMQLFPS